MAGRTDAGVHARGQVAHLDVPGACWAAEQASIARRLARALPADIRVRRIGPAPPGFDARFSALWRRYTYRVCDDPLGPDPLTRHETLWYPRRLDTSAMNAAATACLGEHDFAAFCHNMVRALVGALLRVGDGARPPGWLADVLALGERQPEVPVVVACGLCLEEVGYPADDQLAARAQVTRQRRDSPRAGR